MTGGAVDRLRAQKQLLDRSPPPSAERRAELDLRDDIELTYGSNAIEGGSLSREEIALAFADGAAAGDKPLKDRLEALGHRDALHFVRALAASGRAVREADIREIHRLIAVRTDPAQVGRYRRHRRVVGGPPATIPRQMAEFAVWLAAAPAGPEAAFAAHARLIAIGPFIGGNGRVARLVMNLVLLRAGYPPVVIGPEHHAAYVALLRALQRDGDPRPHRRFMSERLAESLDRQLAVDRGARRPCAE